MRPVRPASLVALCVPLLAGCAGEPEAAAVPGPDAPTASGPVHFSEDPLADAPVLASEETVPTPPSGPVRFAEDPLAGAPVAAPDGPGDEAPAASSGGPDAVVTPVAPTPDTPAFDAELVDRTLELGVAVLEARLLEQELSATARVEAPEGPYRFGAVVPIRFTIQNPFGEPLVLLPPEDGVALQLQVVTERWLPLGGHERIERIVHYRLADLVLLGPGEDYSIATRLPLELEGDPGALWEVRLDARLRFSGARQGEGEDARDLPARLVDFRGAGFLVLPPGWERFQDDPLAALERVVGLPDAAVDRHVLVTTALLQGDDRYRGLEVLLRGLDDAPSAARRLTIVSALEWLTRIDLGGDPEAWQRWRAENLPQTDDRS